MATVNVDLYARYPYDELVIGPDNFGQPTLPPIVVGGTWNIGLYFVSGDGAYLRFAGDPVSARIRAQANNHAYADAQSDGEIPADIVPVVTKVQSASSSTPEIQRVSFPTTPFGGSFKIVFTGAGAGGRGGGFSLEGATVALSSNANSGDIFNAMVNMVGWYKGNDGPYTWHNLAVRYEALTTPIVSGNVSQGFTIQWGSIYAGAQWFNTGIHLVTIDDSSLVYKWGRHITLPFTASDFSDYLIHGPAFFEVFLNGNRAGAIQLTADPALAPAFTNGPPGSGQAGIPYSFSYTASGTPAPSFAVTAGGLPPGLSLDSAGVLSGTPTTAGTYTGTVTASSVNGSVTQSFSIVIAAGVPVAPVFTSGSPANSGRVGSFYDFTCRASGFPFPTFSVTSGALPPGINLASTGRLSGAPLANGNYSGVITATNSAGSDTQNFAIAIDDPAHPPPPVPGGLVNVSGILYDGDHSGYWPIGPMRRENAFPEIPGYYIFRQKWRARRLIWGALILDSPCPEDPNAFCVGETPTEDVGGADLLEWERIWANVPGQIVDGEMVDYEAQITGTNNGAAAIVSYHLSRWATRTRTFYRTTNPGNIPKNVLPRASVQFGILFLDPGFTNVPGGTSTIARDDKIERWMGNIWMRTQWYIIR